MAQANPNCRYCRGAGRVKGIQRSAKEHGHRTVIVPCTCTRGIPPGPNSNPFSHRGEEND